MTAGSRPDPLTPEREKAWREWEWDEFATGLSRDAAVMRDALFAALDAAGADIQEIGNRLMSERDAARAERDEMEHRYIQAHGDGERARTALREQQREVAALREALERVAACRDGTGLITDTREAQIARAALAAGQDETP